MRELRIVFYPRKIVIIYKGTVTMFKNTQFSDSLYVDQYYRSALIRKYKIDRNAFNSVSLQLSGQALEAGSTAYVALYTNLSQPMPQLRNFPLANHVGERDPPPLLLGQYINYVQVYSASKREKIFTLKP